MPPFTITLLTIFIQLSAHAHARILREKHSAVHQTKKNVAEPTIPEENAEKRAQLNAIILVHRLLFFDLFHNAIVL